MVSATLNMHMADKDSGGHIRHWAKIHTSSSWSCKRLTFPVHKQELGAAQDSFLVIRISDVGLQIRAEQDA